jgi:pentatricopeptide repeat protein
MSYAEIKKNLREASRLVDAGNVGEADTLIRSMVGKGLSPADMVANLTPGQMKALREHNK